MQFQKYTYELQYLTVGQLQCGINQYMMGFPVEVKACGWYEKWEQLGVTLHHTLWKTQTLPLDQGKGKFTLEQATKAQKGRRGIAILFL